MTTFHVAASLDRRYSVATEAGVAENKLNAYTIA